MDLDSKITAAVAQDYGHALMRAKNFELQMIECNEQLVAARVRIAELTKQLAEIPRPVSVEKMNIEEGAK